MDMEDHIPQEPQEPTFAETLHALIEDMQIDEASSFVTNELIRFFSYYADDPLLFGLLRIANSVRITESEGIAVNFNTRKKQMVIPHRVAHQCNDILDVVCLLLIERARLVVNKDAHLNMPDGFDPRRDHFEFVLSREVWSSAIARCYVSSILPERIFAPIQDLHHQMMHGLDPRSTMKLLQIANMPATAEVFIRLYNQTGQEMFHANLNRMSSCDDQVTQTDVLVALLADKRNQPNDNDDGNGGDEKTKEFQLVVNPTSDTDAQDNMEEMTTAAHNTELHRIPVASFDLDDDLDQYLNMHMHAQSITSALHGKLQDIARHALIGTHSDDGCVFGSMEVPDRPTYSDLMAHMQGYTPSVWETQLPQKQSDPLFAVYYDVSYSMFQWYNFTRAVVQAIGRNVDPEHVYGFSNVVVPLDVESCYIETTYGTDISAVIAHASENKISNVILITDLDVPTTPQLETTGIANIIVVCTNPQKTLNNSCFRVAVETQQSNFHYVAVSFDEVAKSTTVKGATTFNEKPKP
jgi:hypothetical protein